MDDREIDQNFSAIKRMLYEIMKMLANEEFVPEILKEEEKEEEEEDGQGRTRPRPTE